MVPSRPVWAKRKRETEAIVELLTGISVANNLATICPESDDSAQMKGWRPRARYHSSAVLVRVSAAGLLRTRLAGAQSAGHENWNDPLYTIQLVSFFWEPWVDFISHSLPLDQQESESEFQSSHCSGLTVSWSWPRARFATSVRHADGVCRHGVTASRPPGKADEALRHFNAIGSLAWLSQILRSGPGERCSPRYPSPPGINPAEPASSGL